MRLDLTRAIGAAKACAAAALTLLIAACASGPVRTATTGPQPVAIPVAEYVLGAGDQVKVNVFGENEMSGTFAVDGSGAIALPLVGNMNVAGKTLREFEAVLEAKLKEGYLNEPRVSAEVANFRPFYILGEVNGAGTYPFTSGLTVQNAVATAKGFTYRADQRRVFIKHQGETNEIEYPLTTTTPVQPGDTIRIPERLF
jgi:polysaccharide export outer membrane protein